MIHYMNLHSRPFEMIAEGHKTIELRLLDEKRQKIAVGDTLVFTNTADPELQLRCIVKKLHRFANFAELYAALPMDRCGYLPEELATARPEDMDLYYPPEKQAQYGVVGIEIEKIG
jgi:ASC-1-like (ASCH) protein